MTRARRSISRLARLINQLMREQVAGGPVTVQQYYVLEALGAGSRTMKELAAAVGVHQSTLTRIVEKLECRGLAARTRPATNQRSVDVEITGAGRRAYDAQNDACDNMIAALIAQIPAQQRAQTVESIELLADLIAPPNRDTRDLLTASYAPEPVSPGGAR